MNKEKNDGIENRKVLSEEKRKRIRILKNWQSQALAHSTRWPPRYVPKKPKLL